MTEPTLCSQNGIQFVSHTQSILTADYNAHTRDWVDREVGSVPQGNGRYSQPIGQGSVSQKMFKAGRGSPLHLRVTLGETKFNGVPYYRLSQTFNMQLCRPCQSRAELACHVSPTYLTRILLPQNTFWVQSCRSFQVWELLARKRLSLVCSDWIHFYICFVILIPQRIRIFYAQMAALLIPVCRKELTQQA